MPRYVATWAQRRDNPSKGRENVDGREPQHVHTVCNTYRLQRSTARRGIIVQNLANGVKFGHKETYMEGLNHFILHNQVGRAAAANASDGTKAKSCTACCDTVHHCATCCDTVRHCATCCNTVRHVVTQCNTVRHVALQCDMLHYSATCCDTVRHSEQHSAKGSRHASCMHVQSCTNRVVCVGRRCSGASGCAANGMWTRAE